MRLKYPPITHIDRAAKDVVDARAEFLQCTNKFRSATAYPLCVSIAAELYCSIHSHADFLICLDVFEELYRLEDASGLEPQDAYMFKWLNAAIAIYKDIMWSATNDPDITEVIRNSLDAHVCDGISDMCMAHDEYEQYDLATKVIRTYNAIDQDWYRECRYEN